MRASDKLFGGGRGLDLKLVRLDDLFVRTRLWIGDLGMNIRVTRRGGIDDALILLQLFGETWIGLGFTRRMGLVSPRRVLALRRYPLGRLGDARRADRHGATKNSQGQACQECLGHPCHGHFLLEN